MEIRDIFILKEGVPIYHKKRVESDLKRDETLVMGFLSALTSFAMEIGAGVPRIYATDKARFSFYRQNDHLFVIYSDLDITDVQVQMLSEKISNAFFENIGGKLTSGNLSTFESHVEGVLEEFYRVQKAPSQLIEEESRYIQQMQKLIPKIHVSHEKLQLTAQRRRLFKLIDGKMSVYDIATRLDENPQRILSILRSYKKEGAISF
ncbi:MAG: hypothetical protein ACXQS8_00625 [Candidatus Helarchaeales archaeon]